MNICREGAWVRLPWGMKLLGACSLAPRAGAGGDPRTGAGHGRAGPSVAPCWVEHLPHGQTQTHLGASSPGICPLVILPNLALISSISHS